MFGPFNFTWGAFSTTVISCNDDMAWMKWTEMYFTKRFTIHMAKIVFRRFDMNDQNRGRQPLTPPV